MKSIPLLVIVSGLLLSSCTTTPELPSDVIPADSMVLILADFYLAEALANESSFNQDAAGLRKSFYKFIMSEHKISFDRLRKSIDFYTAHPEKFAEVSEKVIEELSRRQAVAKNPDASN
jgi:hypothetical protein